MPTLKNKGWNSLKTVSRISFIPYAARTPGINNNKTAIKRIMLKFLSKESISYMHKFHSIFLAKHEIPKLLKLCIHIRYRHYSFEYCYIHSVHACICNYMLQR